MDQYVDNRQKEILWDLLANPADNGSSYIQSLERLVQDNPQSGLLQVLLARTGYEKQLGKAAIYYNPRTLHKVINHPEDLAPVDNANIIHSAGDFFTTQNFFNAGSAQNAAALDAEAFDNNGYDNIGKPETSDADAFDQNGYMPPPVEQVSDVNTFYQNGYTPPPVEEANDTPPPIENISDADAWDNNSYSNTAQQEVIVADELVNEPEPIIEEEIEEPVQIIEQPEVTEEVAEVSADDNVQTHPEVSAETENAVEEEPVEEITDAPVIGSEYNHTYHAFETSEPEKEEEQLEAEPVIENAQPVEAPEAVTEHPVAEEPVAEQPIEETTPVAEQQPAQNTPPPIPQYEAPRFNSRFPKPGAQHASPVTEPEYPQAKQEDIEDEVYDEIVSIEDIGFKQVESKADHTPAEPVAEARFSEPHIDSSPEEEEASEVLFHQPQPVVEPLHDEHKAAREHEERLIMDSAIGADFLSFDKKLDELRGVATPAQQPAPVEDAAPAASTPVETRPTAQLAEPAEQQVSRYDDDKMPYTFMWWLNKTRKEHAENFQPYTNGDTHPANAQASQETANPLKRGSGNELQQQYYENIFSLTSISGVERDAEPAAVEFDPAKKEDVIIERFIHTEPQIKPLSADKLDNENKAKRSSEDQNDFVTETLARIYCDQMLYHKAIATYKKLILKFPEKKLYFAAQIEQLEKKTN